MKSKIILIQTIVLHVLRNVMSQSFGPQRCDVIYERPLTTTARNYPTFSTFILYDMHPHYSLQLSYSKLS